MNLIQNLRTFLCWLQSVDCNEEMFDNVTKHGKFDASLDEVIAETLNQLEVNDTLITGFENQRRRRNLQIQKLKTELSMAKTNEQFNIDRYASCYDQNQKLKTIIETNEAESASEYAELETAYNNLKALSEKKMKEDILFKGTKYIVFWERSMNWGMIEVDATSAKEAIEKVGFSPKFVKMTAVKVTEPSLTIGKRA